MTDRNEIGHAAPRGRPREQDAVAEKQLTEYAGEEIRLPAGAEALRGPVDCPACGASDPMWGCDAAQQRPREAIHPIAWDEHAWMADTFICRVCRAGWVEPDDPEPFRWVRPYWKL